MTKQATTKKIGVLMGGFSSERDISVRSGLAIYQALQELGYDSALIDVGRDIANVLKKDKVKFAFLALHGGMGENGAMQGLLEVLGIPYTGSGILASALAMDKEVSKKLFMHHGLNVAPFAVVNKKSKQRGQKKNNLQPQAFDFSFPRVVKPVSEGSSIGIRIVREEAEMAGALENAFSFGDKALVEKFVEGTEVHIGILGEKVLGGVEVRPSLEFYNYEAKYTSGLTEYIIPPEIDDAAYEKTREMALIAHSALGCSGASRADFIIDKSGAPYILEVNTLPGMTATSLLPKIAAYAGINFKELIEEMVRIAVNK